MSKPILLWGGFEPVISGIDMQAHLLMSTRWCVSKTCSGCFPTQFLSSDVKTSSSGCQSLPFRYEEGVGWLDIR